MPSDRYALVVAASYALLGFFYIFISDHVLAWFLDDPHQITWVQTLKGWTFILLTGLMLFHLVRHGRERSRRAESRLRAADAHFRQMIEGTNDGVWLLDKHGRTEYVNATMANMLGETQASMIGRDAREFASPQVCRFLERALPGRPDDDVLRFDCELRRRDGSKFWALISATLMTKSDGEPVNGMLMITDITSRRTAEEAAQQALQIQRSLLNELDHRVRNNLSSLAGLIDLTRSETDNVDQFAGVMRGRVQAMAKAHALASRAADGGLDLGRLLAEMLPAASRNRFVLDGPPVSIFTPQVMSVALLFHELATRSDRGGALAKSTENVRVSWELELTREASRMVTLRWEESAALAGQDNPRSNALIDGLAERDLGGKAVTRREGARIVHAISIRIDRLGDMSSTPMPPPEVVTTRPAPAHSHN